MKNFTDQFLDFLDATPNEVYDTDDGYGCALFMFLKSRGFPVTCVGIRFVWGVDSVRIMDVPADIWPFHGFVFGSGHSQSYGQLAARIRAARQPTIPQRKIEHA